MEKITTKHGDVEIVYNEDENRWEFEHNGRFRFAITLKLAKDAIDREPKPKKAPFKKFEAYYIGYIGHAATRVTVSSFDGQHAAWVVKEGRRTKERIDNLYLADEKNVQLIAEINAMEEAKEALRKKQDQKSKQLQKLEIPKGE